MSAKLTYREGGSLLHRLHPAIKLLWLITLTGLVFIFQSPILPGIILVTTLAVIWKLNIALGDLRGIRLLSWTAVLIVLLQVVFVEDGTRLVEFGPLLVTDQGVLRGTYLAVRFLVVILLSYVFVLTTSPNDLAYSLMRIGLPYRFGFTLVTALRLLPLFEQEAVTVYRAQRVRGVVYDRKNIPNLLRSFRSLLLPMLVSAISKVDALAISMEGRSYGRYPTRTYFRSREKSSWDLPAGIGLAALVVILVLVRIQEV